MSRAWWEKVVKEQRRDDALQLRESDSFAGIIHSVCVRQRRKEQENDDSLYSSISLPAMLHYST